MRFVGFALPWQPVAAHSQRRSAPSLRRAATSAPPAPPRPAPPRPAPTPLAPPPPRSPRPRPDPTRPVCLLPLSLPAPRALPRPAHSSNPGATRCRPANPTLETVKDKGEGGQRDQRGRPLAHALT
jgi:hypothetical protein